MSINHGNSRMKLSSDVRTRRSPPSKPPIKLMAPSLTVHAHARPISRRYATALDSEAGHIANVDVALAETGATPA